MYTFERPGHEFFELAVPRSEDMDAQNQNLLPSRKQATLLGLPGEIRNAIHRLAIVKYFPPRPITITSLRPPPIEPGILLACRQTRQEAIEIYYQENVFLIDVEGANADTLIRFSSRSKYQHMARIALGCKGSVRSWENLKAWLQAWFEGRCVGVPPSLAVSTEAKLSGMETVAWFFQVLGQLREQEMEWAQIERVLEHMYRAVAAAHGMWK